LTISQSLIVLIVRFVLPNGGRRYRSLHSCKVGKLLSFWCNAMLIISIYHIISISTFPTPFLELNLFSDGLPMASSSFRQSACHSAGQLAMCSLCALRPAGSCCSASYKVITLNLPGQTLEAACLVALYSLTKKSH